MKTYKVYASQLVYLYKEVQAETAEQAEELAFSGSNDTNWKEFDYGEWAIEKTEEVKP